MHIPSDVNCKGFGLVVQSDLVLTYDGPDYPAICLCMHSEGFRFVQIRSEASCLASSRNEPAIKSWIWAQVCGFHLWTCVFFFVDAWLAALNSGMLRSYPATYQHFKGKNLTFGVIGATIKGCCNPDQDSCSILGITCAGSDYKVRYKKRCK